MAAQYDITYGNTAPGYTRRTTTSNLSGTGCISKYLVVLDFAKIKAARAAAGLTALAATDTIGVMDLPKGSVVFQAGVYVAKQEVTSTTATFDLGFYGGSPAAANIFGNDKAYCDANAVVGSVHADGAVNPVVVTADDTLDLLLNTAVPQEGIFHVWAFVGSGLSTAASQ